MSLPLAQIETTIRMKSDFSELRNFSRINVLLSSSVSSYFALATYLSCEKLAVRIADKSDLAESIRTGCSIQFIVELGSERFLSGTVLALIGSTIVGDDGKRYADVCLSLEDAFEIEIPTAQAVWLT